MLRLEPWTCTAHFAAHKSCFRTPVWTADRDKNGLVDLNEFLCLMATMSRKDPEGKLALIFSMCMHAGV